MTTHQQIAESNQRPTRVAASGMRALSTSLQRKLTLRARGFGDELPALSGTEASIWREAYNVMVADLAAHFGRDSGWWFVPLSSRDHFGSPMQDRFQLAARLKLALNSKEPRTLTVVSADGAFADSLGEMARAAGWNVVRPLAERLTWFSREFARRRRNTTTFARRMLRLVQHWRAGRVAATWREDSTGLDAVVVAPLHLPVHRFEDGSARDTYFGELPRKMRKAGERVIVTGPLLLASPLAHAKEARGLHSVPVIALESMITFQALLRLIWRSLSSWLFPPRLPRDVKGQLPGLSLLVAREIEDAIETRLRGIHLEYAFEGVLARSPAARIMHTAENNHWERAIDRPAQTHARGSVIGYLHCAVLESHLKNHVRASERPYRPAPDCIVCTGPAARDVLLTLGEFDPRAVLAGCALRGPGLKNLPVRMVPPKRVQTILVLCEGLPTIPKFARFVADSLPWIGERRVVLRAHPVFPAADVAKLASIKFAPEGQIEASTTRDLVEDIEAADAVVFKASSTVFVAGYMGLPLIHYSDDGWLRDDPLCGCDSLKFEVSRPEDFASAIARIEAMDEATFRQDHAALRGYLDRYLAAPTPETMAPFLAPERLV